MAYFQREDLSVTKKSFVEGVFARMYAPLGCGALRPHKEIGTVAEAKGNAVSPPKRKSSTVVAETITELIRFEPEICICNGN